MVPTAPSPCCSTGTAQTIAPTQPSAVSEKKLSTHSRRKNHSLRKMELRSHSEIHNAGTDPKATTAITSANSQTPFLRLPQELKNRVYELVLGGNMLHIMRDSIKSKRKIIHSTKGYIKEQRFTHQICRSWISEEDAQHRFDTEDGISWYVKDIEGRHSNCSVSKCSVSVPFINLLHACRQIYNEAHFVPYSTNRFSFDTPRNLRAFIHFLTQRGVDVNSAIRSLHVDFAIVDRNLDAWTRAFNAVTQHMTLLEEVFINVDQSLELHSADPERTEGVMRRTLDCLAILGKTPAKSINIIVGDPCTSYRFQLNHPTHLWKLDAKRLWVGKVKLAIQDVQVFG